MYGYLLIYHKDQLHVGKYTSPMDPMGLKTIHVLMLSLCRVTAQAFPAVSWYPGSSKNLSCTVTKHHGFLLLNNADVEFKCHIGTYCWWKNLKQLISSLSHYLQGFKHPRWCRFLPSTVWVSIKKEMNIWHSYIKYDWNNQVEVFSR